MAYNIKDTTRTIDGNGTLLEETQRERTVQKDQEPDYIKIYTSMWFDFKQFPAKYRELFLQLAIRMTYCNMANPQRSQIVAVIGDLKDEIMEACGWKTVDPLMKGLKSLCDCGAIKRTRRGCYQINPEFAGKGPWRYNPRLEQGGVKDLITTFRFANGTVETDIYYDDDAYHTDDDDGDQVYAAASQSDLDVIASMSGKKSSDDVEQ